MQNIQGKNISILGDSISTYVNVSNNTNYNKTIGYNPVFYFDQISLQETYWMIVINKFNLNLCVNNAWSGGYLTYNVECEGCKDNAVYSRAKHLSNNDGLTPDIILLFIGVNDLNAKVDANKAYTYYKETLKNISESYPNAITFCLSLPKIQWNSQQETDEYNVYIKKAIKEAGNNFVLVDFDESDMQDLIYSKRSFDTLHPNKEGMQCIASLFINAIEKYYK